jgi:hypothetical protein
MWNSFSRHSEIGERLVQAAGLQGSFTGEDAEHRDGESLAGIVSTSAGATGDPTLSGRRETEL